MKPTNLTPIGHSLEAYLRSRELVFPTKPRNLQTSHSKLRPHRRLIRDDYWGCLFKLYKKRGD